MMKHDPIRHVAISAQNLKCWFSSTLYWPSRFFHFNHYFYWLFHLRWSLLGSSVLTNVGCYKACRKAFFNVSHRKKYRRDCSFDCRDREVVRDYLEWMLRFVWLTLMPTEIARMTRHATSRRSPFTQAVPVVDLQCIFGLRFGLVWWITWWEQANSDSS